MLYFSVWILLKFVAALLIVQQANISCDIIICLSKQSGWNRLLHSPSRVQYDCQRGMGHGLALAGITLFWLVGLNIGYTASGLIALWADETGGNFHRLPDATDSAFAQLCNGTVKEFMGGASDLSVNLVHCTSLIFLTTCNIIIRKRFPCHHYGDVIMCVVASQITSLAIVYSTVYSDADQRKHQSSASLAFVRGIPRDPGNSPHKWPVTRKMFPSDDVIMMMPGYCGKYETFCMNSVYPFEFWIKS